MSLIEKPVVDTIDTVWNANSLNDGDGESLVNMLIHSAIIKIKHTIDMKNLNSGSNMYLRGFFL